MGNSFNQNENRIATPLFVNLIFLNLFSSSMAQMNTAGSPVLALNAGVGSAYGGTLVAVFVTACMISRVVSGAQIDNSGRKQVLVRGTLVYLAGCMTAILIPGLWALIPARILQGWGFSAVHTAASTCAADVLPEKRLGEGLGYYGLGHAVAMAAGPMVGVTLADTGFIPALALGAACAALIVLALSLAVRYEAHPETLPPTSGYRAMRERQQSCAQPCRRNESHIKSAAEQEKLRQAQKQPFDFRTFLAATFEISALKSGVPMLLVGATIGFFISFTAVFAKGSGFGNPSLFFALAAATSFAVRIVCSKSLDRQSPRALFAVPIGAGVLTIASMYWAPSELLFNICGIGYGICLGISIPLLSAMAVKFAPPERWGAANALFFCLYDIGIGYGALLWGILNDAFGFLAVFLAAASCLLAAFGTALLTLAEK